MSNRQTIIVDHGLTVWFQGAEPRWNSALNALTAEEVVARIGMALHATGERTRQLHALRVEVLRVVGKEKRDG